MSKKVLIVDDEVYVRTLLEQMLEDLEDAGVQLILVGDGAEAWDVVRSEQPTLVILDVMIPTVSGFEVCQRIKSDAELASIHVMLLTSKSQEMDRLRGVEVGADEYVTKPFDPDALSERIAAILDVRV
jgi:two-component system alkaline phosphatase synthesis response regulator PhoP